MKLYNYIIKKVSRCITLAPFMCLFFVCSCRSSQNLTKEVGKDYSRNLKLLTQRIDSVTKSMTMNQLEIFKRISNLNVEGTTVVYSPPDSTGSQYPMQRNTIKINKEVKENNRTDTDIIDEAQQLSTSIEDLKEIKKSTFKCNSIQVQQSWWDRNKDKVYSGFILIVIGLVLFRLKNKL